MAPRQNISGNPDPTERFLKRHINSLLFIRVCLFTLLLCLTAVFQMKGHSVILPSLPVVILFVLFITAYSAGSAVLTGRKSTRLPSFGVLQLLSDTVFTAALIYATGCSQSIFTPIMILPIITGGLILHKTGGLIPAAAATILYGAVLGLEHLHVIPAYFYATAYNPDNGSLASLNLFTVYGITFFVTALVSGQLAGRLRLTEKELSKTTFEYDRLSILYKQIFDDIATGIITTNQQNLITSFNNAAERITGFSKDEVLGSSLTDSFPTLLLDSAERRNVCDLTRKDRVRIRVGFSYSSLNMPAQGGNDETTQWRVITLQDISKIEAMEKQMREAEKMAAIGELSASIAHDFRNPLAAISGSAQILNIDLADDGARMDKSARALVTIINRESNRMAKTINDFLLFARPTEVVQEWFDLRRMVEETVNDILAPADRIAGRGVAMEINDHINCWADRQQLQTVLSHLLENAFSVIDKAGGDTILVRAREMERAGMEYICVEVCDMGPGIPGNLRKEVFKPFYSTREDCTGLGLAIVRQIIDNHRGTVEITQDQEYSCIIRLMLPVPQSSTQPHA